MNFANDTGFRYTSSNAYAGLNAPVLKKNNTSDNFNHKPYQMNRGGSQHMAGARGGNDFNNYFRSSAAIMFANNPITMPKIATSNVRMKF